MWKLHRYYLKELTVNAAITFLVLFAVVLVSLIARGIQRAESGGTIVHAALFVLFFALDSLPHLLTIAFLVATVLTYSRAVLDRELTAIRAAGISPRTPMVPAVLAGILLSCVASLAMHYVIPEVHFRKYRVIADVMRSVFANLRPDSDRIPVPGTDGKGWLTFREREGYSYRDCTLYLPAERRIAGLRSSILRVDRVSIAPFDEHSASIEIRLDGVRDPIEGHRFDVPLEFDMRDVANRSRRNERDDDVRSDQLLAEVLRGVHPRPQDALYTLFRRCCFALMPALLAPIGFCIAEFTRERGRVMALVFALVPLVMFYLGEVLGARTLQLTQNPWSAWMPALMLSAVGVPLCWRQLRR